MNAKLLHGVRSKVNQTKIKMASQNFVQGPKMDWTVDPELHRCFREWREETELLVNTALAHIKDKTTKLKFVTLWAGKEARTYLTTILDEKKDSLQTLLNTLEDWTRPKADEIAAYPQLRALNQGNKTLSMYIQEVRRLVDLCNLDCNADKDKLIRNSIIAGINSTKAYQQCISKCSSLSLDDCIKICQMEDATHRQVQALCPESSDCNDSTPVHKISKQPQYHQGRAAYGGYRGRGGRPFQGNWPQCRQDYRQSTAPMCEYCRRTPDNSRQECRALGMECYTCHKFGHLSHICRQNTKSDKTEVKHIDMEEESQDWPQSEYTTPFYSTNDQVKASVKCLKTTTKLHYMKNRDNEHIRPLWIAQSENSKIHQTDCEVHTSSQSTEPRNYSVRND